MSLAATRKMLSTPPRNDGAHLYGATGQAAIQSLLNMGVDVGTLNELNRHAENNGVPLSNIWTVALQYFQTNGVQIFQVILNLIQKLTAGGFSLATIESLLTEDGGKYKALIASLLAALGQNVPSILAE